MRWRTMMLSALLFANSGCAIFKPKPQVILPANHVPVKLKAGETFTAPWDGWYMESGVSLNCFDRCADEAAAAHHP